MAATAAWLVQAQSDCAAGRYDAAAKACQRALERRPRDLAALNLLALALMRQGDARRAVEVLGRSLALEARQPGAWLNLGNAQRELGRDEAALAAFDRALGIDDTLAAAHRFRGNALFALGRAAEARAAYERALALDPGDAHALDNLGVVVRALGDAVHAERLHLQALLRRPGDPVLLLHLGSALADQGRLEEAAAHLRAALAGAPGSAATWYQLGVVLTHLQDLVEAVACFDRAQALRPEWAHPALSRGTALMGQGRFAEGLASYDRALVLAPGWAEAQSNRATALLTAGDYVEGWALHEARLASAKRTVRPIRERRWDGSPLAGRHLLIRAEQGLGDAIQFVRYAALCKAQGATVTVDCHPPLVRWFQLCPYLDAAATDVGDEGFDVQIEMMSLPHRFGTALDTVPATIPYLFVDEGTRARWRARVGAASGLKVGVAWAGNPRRHEIASACTDLRRSVALDVLSPLLAVEGATFYSLQVGEHAGDVARIGLQGRIIDLTGEITDYLETAALVDQLDLVITVDTSVAHAAGALGKPVWILSRFDACWRWLANREESPWYPSAWVVGQPAPGAWTPVIERVCAALRDRCARHGDG